MIKKAILESRDSSGDWTKWRIVTLLENNKNTWKIRSWNVEDWFGRYVHKEQIGERVREL
jgi:hypothetical protein